MKIGIFGGSFDPVHKGHISAALEVLRLTHTDEVWFMPCPRNPMKSGLIASFEDRCKMIELAIEGIPRLKVSDLQDIHNLTYTIDTVRDLKRKFPEHEFYWIIGSDLIDQFPNWQEPEKIMGEIQLVVVPLPNYVPITNEMVLKGSPIVLNHAKKVDVSSTMVRSQIAIGEDVSHLVSPKVADFIKENRIYE